MKFATQDARREHTVPETEKRRDMAYAGVDNSLHFDRISRFHFSGAAKVKDVGRRCSCWEHFFSFLWRRPKKTIWETRFASTRVEKIGETEAETWGMDRRICT